ncbi:hypothetical protein B0H19DRAFT_1142675 [Mycena capillaripes]|nr:hypothetical protein B0H19DRAFT_1142675 [Mycena capillaripes]
MPKCRRKSRAQRLPLAFDGTTTPHPSPLAQPEPNGPRQAQTYRRRSHPEEAPISVPYVAGHLNYLPGPSGNSLMCSVYGAPVWLQPKVGWSVMISRTNYTDL